MTQGVPTVGRIANGALVEREIHFQLASLRSMRLSLRNPDLTTAKRMESSINRFLGTRAAEAIDPATVRQLASERQDPGVVELMVREQRAVMTLRAARVPSLPAA